jgi:hypothetical protein
MNDKSEKKQFKQLELPGMSMTCESSLTQNIKLGTTGLKLTNDFGFETALNAKGFS